MIGKKILALFKESKMSYLSVEELASFSGANRSSLKVTLSRLVKQKSLIRLLHGYYALPDRNPDLEQIAIELEYPAYLSLEYALAIHGILSQTPSRLTLITKKRSAEHKTSTGIVLEFSHIKPSLFFGYEIKGQTQIARPEKALLDTLYLIGLGKRKLDISGLDTDKLNKNLIKKWLKLYPPSTARLIASLAILG